MQKTVEDKQVRIALVTSRRRIEVISALAEMEGLERDDAINDAMYHWALDRVDEAMEKRLRHLFS